MSSKSRQLKEVYRKVTYKKVFKFIIWDQPEKTGNTSQHTPSYLNVNQTNTKRLPIHPNGSSKEKGNPISPKREHRSFKLSLLQTKTKKESLCTIRDIGTVLAITSLIIGYALLDDGCSASSAGSVWWI